MPSKTIKIQPITPQHLADVLDVQRQAHSHSHLETAEVLNVKITQSASFGAIAYDVNNLACGYLLAYAAPLDYASGFCNTFMHDKNAVSLYIHDMAISPRFQGTGVAQLLYQYALKIALAQNMKYSTLVAVNGAEHYWSKLGYSIVSGERVELASYDGSAFFMQKEL